MDLLVRFMKPTALGKQSGPGLKSLPDIKFSSTHSQDDDYDLVIGVVGPRQYIHRMTTILSKAVHSQDDDYDLVIGVVQGSRLTGRLRSCLRCSRSKAVHSQDDDYDLVIGVVGPRQYMKESIEEGSLCINGKIKFY
ncbi:hypothetical protein PR048_016569 [Dryococelus australis]|uniref:Uncharacterized protein n=1 Tax=Dryococelus australis TaxID=614101 RepID=A0ABQ9HK62_9NEOP|nr:hypothetical protein PR048_016569 [Dryococelus australis]